MSSSPRAPRALATVESSEFAGIRGVCLDIDDTLSTHGKLTAEAYSALWDLKKAGFWVVPITGRPAGWCDLIGRFWPVDAVVGENGAFTLFQKDGRLQRLTTPGASPNPRPEINRLHQAVLARFPQAKVASDQAYRDYDLAIDFCEDVPAWPQADVDELLALCAREGAHAKLSSIHVNAWFGDYDKRRGFEHWLSQAGPSAPKVEEWIFAGDSPNDEPLFAAFRHSVGVANLVRYLPRLKTPPTYLAASESGAGFVELASKLLATGRR